MKQRPTIIEATEAATLSGRRRIARAAAAWLARNPAAAEGILRFDVVVAAPGRLPRHLAGVFDADGVA